MKAIFYIIVLAALGYGGLYVYENYLAESVNYTIANTADFATCLLYTSPSPRD